LSPNMKTVSSGSMAFFGRSTSPSPGCCGAGDDGLSGVHCPCDRPYPLEGLGGDDPKSL
jgi:hypothetical protein